MKYFFAFENEWIGWPRAKAGKGVVYTPRLTILREGMASSFSLGSVKLDFGRIIDKLKQREKN